MGFHRGPKIVTDGLVLHLDAANPKSYPGSGTTWSDLSGNRLNGTLTNGPVYNSDNNGSLVFDGGNDTVLVNNVTTNTITSEGNTVEQWLYWNGGGNEMPFSWFDTAFDIWISSGGIGINNGASLVYGAPSSGFQNNWKHFVCFFPNNWSTRKDDTKIWVNGIPQIITRYNGSFANRTVPNPATISIGSGYNGSINYNFGGKIASTKIYARELSSQEVLQNYNATKSRYGL